METTISLPVLSDETAMDLIYELASSVGYNIAVWQRGGQGKNSGMRQQRALAALFIAMTGRKANSEQIDKMGGGAVFGG